MKGSERTQISLGEIMDLTSSIGEQKLWSGSLIRSIYHRYPGAKGWDNGLKIYDPHMNDILHIRKVWGEEKLLSLTYPCTDLIGTTTFHLSSDESIYKLWEFEDWKTYHQAVLVMQEFYHLVKRTGIRDDDEVLTSCS